MALHPVADVRAFLAGRWSVERELDDGGMHGDYRGVATFAPDDDGVDWLETGELAVGGYRGPARRRLRLVPAAGAWEVRFDDGRPFHPLDLSSGRWRASHDCGPDRYDGAFAVSTRDAFEVAWDVRGPAKRQRIVSRYRRL